MLKFITDKTSESPEKYTRSIQKIFNSMSQGLDEKTKSDICQKHKGDLSVMIMENDDENLQNYGIN